MVYWAGQQIRHARLVDRRRGAEAVLITDNVWVPVGSRKNKIRATVVGVAGSGHKGGVRLL